MCKKEDLIQELSDQMERGEPLIGRVTKVRVPIVDGKEVWDEAERVCNDTAKS